MLVSLVRSGRSVRWAALGAGMALGIASPAWAGLIGAGRTVEAVYLNGSTSSTEVQTDAATNIAGPASLASSPGANFLQGLTSGSTVSVSDTQIVITDKLSYTPYCSTGSSFSSCTDTISGFQFLFTGESISSVTVDAASASSMTPVTATYGSVTHTGLTLVSSNQITVDLTGALPSAGNELILNVVTSSPAVGTPEPSSAGVLMVGLFGILGMLAMRPRSPGRPAV